MQNLKALATGAAAALMFGLSGLAANAADLGGAPYQSIKDEPFPEAPYRYYFAVRGGVTFPEDTDFRWGPFIGTFAHDTGYTVSGAAGIKLDGIGLRGFRGELEGGYTESSIRNGPGHSSVTFGLASVYYDFQNFGPLRPFVGGGVGVGGLDLAGFSDTGLAYHGTAGVALDLGRGFNLELAYRYFGVTGADPSDHGIKLTDVDYNSHQILLGLRKSF
jgi:opacity protein-like surface antigen